METFELNENHQLVLSLITLCKITKNSNPIAYMQYRLHLEMLKLEMMKEFDNEDLGNNSFY